MDGASRHAQRLASNFLDDLDAMQRASRARDRRAMSHLEIGTRTGNWFPAHRRHSLSHASIRSVDSPGSYETQDYHTTTTRIPYSQSRFVSYPSPSVMLVGKPFRQPATYSTESRVHSNYSNLSQSVSDLPTSALRAHPPVPRPIMTPRAQDYVDNILSSQRRRSWLTYLYDDFEEPVSRTVYRSYTPRPPNTYTRLSSVPPVSSYRPVYYTSEFSTPSVSVPRTYYRTSRYITETPYYLSPYSTRIGEPSRPILTTHYSTAPTPVTQRSTYYYPAVTTMKRYYSPVRTVSYANMTPEVQYERRRIGRRMDDLLDYKLPSPEYYREMRGSLRGLHDKMDEHRRLLDRYAGVEMDAASSSVGDRIESKYLQLANRMGRGSSVMARA